MYVCACSVYVLRIRFRASSLVLENSRFPSVVFAASQSEKATSNDDEDDLSLWCNFVSSSHHHRHHHLQKNRQVCVCVCSVKIAQVCGVGGGNSQVFQFIYAGRHCPSSPLSRIQSWRVWRPKPCFRIIFNIFFLFFFSEGVEGGRGGAPALGLLWTDLTSNSSACVNCVAAKHPSLPPRTFDYCRELE